MSLLPDLIGPQPLVLLCGMATAGCQRDRLHYYEGVGNAFWELLHGSGLLPEQLTPEQDVRVVEHRIGLTDVVRRYPDRPGEPTSYDVAALSEKVETWQPEWLAFTSKTTAAAVAGVLGQRRPRLGPAPWEVSGASVYVLPGTSGANRRHDYDGRPDRLAWWSDLAALVGR